MRDFALPALLGLAFMLGSIYVAASDSEVVDAFPRTSDVHTVEHSRQELRLLDPIDCDSLGDDGLVQAAFVLEYDAGSDRDNAPRHLNLPLEGIENCGH